MGRIVGTVEEQLDLEKLKEEEGIKKAIAELESAIRRDEFSSTVYGRLLLKLGFDKYVEALEEYLSLELVTHKKKEQALLRLLCDDVKSIAYVSLLECINSSATTKSLSFTATQIVLKLKDAFLFNKLKADNPKLHTYLGTQFRKANRRQKRVLIQKHIKKLYRLGAEVEDKSLMIRLGTTLIDVLEKSGANIIRVGKTSKVKSGVSTYVNTIHLTEEATDIIKSLEVGTMALENVNKLPMIVPPKDWSTPTNGGFLRGRNFLFTVKSSDVSKHLRKNRYQKVYPVINKLQKTKWRVNVRVLELVRHIFDNNLIDPKSPDKAPYLFGNLPVRDVYSADDFIRKDMYPTWHEYNKEREQINIRATATNSKRLELLLTLSVAEKMQKYEGIYYPYILDYRGRVYSDVNFLTPQGQHYTKAMLEFGDGEVLDKNGIFWLKVHLANTYGLDKKPYEERVKWVDDNEEMILRVAFDPTDNFSDWVWCDSPFEFFAACDAYMRSRMGEPVHLAIQLDATCSGIQMYSGLLRDREGALSVNVIGDTRNDIYQMVADRVNKHLEDNNFSQWIDYIDGEGKEHTLHAEPVGRSMIGNITRKIVKRNVMTVPYSVTRKGMSNQLWDMIDEASLKGQEFWQGDKWVANKILTQLNHRSIYEIIDGARKGQEYLVELSKTLDDSATWKGVLYDFPVRQTALSMKEKRVQTIYGSLSINVETPKLNRMRQANSIAPNFVHNIDSTLLMYCIEHMSTQIGVIHDCFLVHPNDGYEIQECYKEGFVAVMEADPLRNIQKQLDPEGLVEFPEYGDLDLNEVRDSKYIIS
jgi:DNA-directed RNA polymerase